MSTPVRLLLLVAALCSPIRDAVAEPVRDCGIAVTASHAGDAYVVEVKLDVPAPVRTTWDVFTDWDHMANFAANLRSSRVIERSGNVLRVEQQGQSTFGPLKFDFDYVREVRLVPYEKYDFHLVRGTFRRFDAEVRFENANRSTRVVYHAQFAPKQWAPVVLGLVLIRLNAREQFLQLCEEIVRRHHGTAASPSNTATKK